MRASSQRSEAHEKSKQMERYSRDGKRHGLPKHWRSSLNSGGCASFGDSSF